jgi:hypothetical protein
MSLVLLFHYLLLNMFRMLVHPSSGACDLLWIYPYAGWSLYKDTTPPQTSHTVTPTHVEPEQYNTWNKSTISRKLLKIDVLTLETCWAVNSEIIKQVTSSWFFFIQLLNESFYFCLSFNHKFVKIVAATVPSALNIHIWLWTWSITPRIGKN